MGEDKIKADWVVTSRELKAEEIADAKSFFMMYGPEDLSIVVREMQEMGWSKFVLRDIRGSERTKVRGLAEGLGWIAEWRARKRREIAKIAELGGRVRGLNVAAEKNARVAGKKSAGESDDECMGTAAIAATPQALKELKFEHWLPTTRPKWNWNWRYQKHIFKRLAPVTNGTARRLAIFLPPRHGKSELVTVRYAAWRLLQKPGLRIVIGSYNQKLANKFSRRAKTIYLEALYGERDGSGGAELVKESMDEWETAEGGGVKAVGLGAGITGFGADLIIIDDPIKGRADAESKTVRDAAWDWYTDDLLTRLEPKGSVILIQTRWHEDDLAGRLLKRKEAGREKWDVVSLPALAEKGDPLKRKPDAALCSERFDQKALTKKKAEMGAYSFAALYQQRPVPAEGALFKREWFSRVVEEAPKGLRWCRGYDLAVSTKTSADFTASFRCAIDREGNLYIADGFKQRVEYPEQRRYIVGRLETEKDTEHGIELALHGEAFVQEIRRETRFCGRAVRGVRVTADKFTRALAWANRAEAGKVVLVRGAWNEEFLEEVCRFPNGPHDDQVDAVSLAVQMLGERKKFAYGF